MSDEIKEPVEEEPKEDFEEQAKQIGGYMTEEEWVAKGKDPADWRDPKTFVEIGEKINKNYKERFEKSESETKKLKEELDAYIRTTDDQLGRVRKDALEKAKADYEQELAKIKEEKRDAFETLDYDKLEQAETKEKELTPPEEPKKEEKPAYVEPPKDFITWQKENPWFQTDEDLTAYAQGMANKLQMELKIPDGIELYNAVTERVKRAFPDKFKNPKREEAPTVEGETADETPPSNGKSFKDLPKSAKEAYKKQKERFEMQGHDFPKEQYVESYFKQFAKEM